VGSVKLSLSAQNFPSTGPQKRVKESRVSLSKNEFFSSIEPFFGKYCRVFVHADLVSLELWLRLDGFSRADGLLTFSRSEGDSVTVNIGAARSFDFGRAGLAPADMRARFGRVFGAAAASALVDGAVRVTLLFDNGRG